MIPDYPTRKKALGGLVRAFREDKGLSCAKVAQKCGLTIERLQHIEEDGCSLDQAVQIITALSSTNRYLYCISEAPLYGQIVVRHSRAEPAYCWIDVRYPPGCWE